jgi:pyrroline-5-carboxylate reductase
MDLKPAVILLAVKPQFMDEALGHYKRMAGPKTTFLSIAAGKTVAYFKKMLGEDALIVRSMPNTPAAVSRGMTVICRDPNVPADILALAAICSPPWARWPGSMMSSCSIR